jgi:hypothetical protein
MQTARYLQTAGAQPCTGGLTSASTSAIPDGKERGALLLFPKANDTLARQQQHLATMPQDINRPDHRQLLPLTPLGHQSLTCGCGDVSPENTGTGS